MKRFSLFITGALVLAIGLVLATAFPQFIETAVAFGGIAAVGALMSDLRSPLSACKTMRFTNDSGGDLTSGDYYLENETFGLVLEDTADTEDGVMVTETGSQGVVVAKAAVAIEEGEDAFYDDGNTNFTNDGTGNLQNVGYFCEPAAMGAATVRVVLQQGKGLSPT